MPHPMSERCPATSKRSGERCRRLVVGGGPCAMHGGKAPQVSVRREARVATWEAQQGQDPIEARDPADALLAAARTADELAQRLQQDLRQQVQMTPAKITALGDWLDRAGRLSKTALDARIDERKLRISEATGTQLGQVLIGVLTELGHDVSPGSHAAEVVRKHLAPLLLAPQPPLYAIEGGGS